MREMLKREQRERILNSLLNKFRTDPEGFCSYLPDVAKELEQSFAPHRKGQHSSNLTELERERLVKALLVLLGKMDLSKEEAVRGLEYCATLIQDRNLPPEVQRSTLLRFYQQAAGTSLSSVMKSLRFDMAAGQEAKEIALLRGVHLHLTWDDKLVAMSVRPEKAKERSKALNFVGLWSDSASDVALHHDSYLVEGVRNANA